MAEPFDQRRFQVFVSSTFRDLQEERQRVLQAILEIRAFPAGMEIFPSADDEQWEFIKREIDSSDYYIVIIAGKYGSLASDGLSFTEKEYDYAIEIKKPVMGFLAKDLDQLRGAQLEASPGPKASLERFRLKVSSGKLVKFFSNPDELKSQVLQALMHAFTFTPADGWIRARNARRMEDLEEIAVLQKRVFELEKENSRLQRANSDPTLLLAREDDLVEWEFIMKVACNTSEYKKAIEHGTEGQGLYPPVSYGRPYKLRTSWNQILLSCFRGGTVQLSEGGEDDQHETVKSNICALARAIIKEEFPDCGSWIAAIGDSVISSGTLRQIIRDVRVQFLGLGYITFEQHDGNPVHQDTENSAVWILTQKGLVQIALLQGKHRV